jgi:hypothetical protein
MKLFIFLLLLCFSTSAFYQQEDVILWNKNQRLSWKDFTGLADEKSSYYAATFASIRYRYQYSSTGKVYNVKFEVYSYFTKSKSWSKKERQSVALLQHEQLHFDITELYARKLKEELERNKYTENYKSEIAEIFNIKKRELKQMEDKYDEETNHSQNKEKQQEWENYVAKELSKSTPAD